jgi:hypothetical protein
MQSGIDLRSARMFGALGHRGRQTVQQLIVDLHVATRVDDRVREIRDVLITKALGGSVGELGGPDAAVRRWGVGSTGRPRYLRGRVAASARHRHKDGGAENSDPEQVSRHASTMSVPADACITPARGRG